MSKKSDPPHGFPAGSRTTRPHDPKGWDSKREDPKFDQEAADRRAAEFRERHRDK